MKSLREAWRSVRLALATVFLDETRQALAAGSAVLFAVLYVLVPVFTIPGNTLEFWLAIAPWWTYALLAAYSAGMGLLVAMMHYVLTQDRHATGAAAAGLVPGFFSGLYSTAACAGCLAGVFSFLGSGATLFLLEHRDAFLLAGGGLTLSSLYFFSGKVNGACASCQVKEEKRT
ncbi:hypothetical protein HY572_06100 [Candidatus Micrarchaeota archaeon]|nr:hypothetical protein [Candidatus Micrarchaeota archaeon]